MSPRFDSLITTMGLMLDGDTTTAKWRAIISGLLLTTPPNIYHDFVAAVHPNLWPPYRYPVLL